MLSPGKWHKLVPKERTANLKFRLKLLRLCRKSAKYRAAIREACRQDILFWINAFVWQFNPRKKGQLAVGPFITWDFQDKAVEEMLWCIENDEDLFIDKSREMGASWLCLIVFEWLWHFHPWQKFLIISRNEDAVDDRADPDSLFWKIDFIHENLPDWMMPRGWDKKAHRIKLSYTNPENRSTITGQASTGKAGVGGRATAMFIDEFSQIREDYEVLHRTSDTTGCRIFNGTHKGQGTAFHELSQRVDIRKLRMHWTQHPDKRPGLYRYNKEANQIEVLDKAYDFPPDFEFVRTEAPAGGPCPGLRSPWYDKECLRKGDPRAVAMDLDIDPGGSTSQFFNPLTIRSLIASYARPPVWEGDISYDPDSGKPEGLIEIPGGPLKLWLQLNDGKIPRDKYGCGADLSTGVGATNSCLSWTSGTTGEKVAAYATPHIPPERLAVIACAICYLFRDEADRPCLFGWEHHGPGLNFGKKVVELGYPNIFYREAHASLAGGKISTIPGWYPSNEMKLILLNDYRAALDARQYVNREESALKECLEYHYDPQGNVVHPEDVKSNDPTGARINHGDRVIADALSWKMAKSLGRIGRKGNETSNVVVGSLAWRRMLHETGYSR